MEDWEFAVRNEIVSDYAADRKADAYEKMNELMLRKNGGKFFRYRPLDDAELELIRHGNMYFCRAIRFEGNGDGYVRFKSYLSCFTDDRKSVPMWFDYADCGRGMCLEYNYEAIEKFADVNGLIFLPVRYDDGIFQVDGSENSIVSMMTKGCDRASEYEWLLWKMDLRSSDIGKILSSIVPSRIHIGKMADRASAAYRELISLAEEKGIDIEESGGTAADGYKGNASGSVS